MPTYRAIHFEEATREGSQHFERESLRRLRASAHLPIAVGGGARTVSVEDAGGSWLDCDHPTLRPCERRADFRRTRKSEGWAYYWA